MRACERPADQMPAVPDYEWIRVPATHRHVSKTFESCNYLQALEGGLDTDYLYGEAGMQ